MNEELENTIQLDEFEVDALEKEVETPDPEEALESNSNKSDEEVEEVEDVDVESDAEVDDDEEESAGHEVDDPAPKKRTVANRINKVRQQEQLKTAEETKRADALQARIDQLEAFNKSESERAKLLQDEINKDNLIDDHVKELAKPAAAPVASNEPKVKIFDTNFNQQVQLIAGQELELKMLENAPSTHHIQRQKLAMHITNGNIPYDVVQLANNHANGAKFIESVVSDVNVLNEIRIASIESKDIDTFSLKFNELADRVNVDSEEDLKPSKKKVKPVPNDPLKPSPKVDNTNDDTVFLT